jgi:hypothetical protein
VGIGRILKMSKSIYTFKKSLEWLDTLSTQKFHNSCQRSSQTSCHITSHSSIIMTDLDY